MNEQTSASEQALPAADEAVEPIVIRKLERLEATGGPLLGVSLN